MGLKFLILSSFFVLASCRHKALVLKDSEPGLQEKGNQMLFRGEPFSGIIYVPASDGDTISTAMYQNGLPEGWTRQWYDNGQLREVRRYHAGRKTGEHRGWWLDGKLRFVYHFDNDLMEGLQQDWSDKGQLFREFHYHLGQEEGMQKMWYEDGSIRMNYKVVKGRRYGLQGVKNCDTTENKSVAK